MPSEYSQRREILAARLADEAKVDALIVSFLPNVRYLTGFTGSNALLALTTEGRAMVFTDPRYETQVAEQVDCPAQVRRGSLWHAAAGWVARRRFRKLGIESARVTIEQRDEFAAKLPKPVRLIGVGRVVETQRMVKSEAEVETIAHAVRINSMAYAVALARFQPEMTEQALAAEIDYQMRRAGAEDTAFDTIVASGARSALPHAHPSNVPIAKNQYLLIDMGARYEGYTSDMTRVTVPGRIPAALRNQYGAVLEAQLAAIDAVKPGATAGAVDAAARLALKKHKMDSLFVHSTGHGLGLEIHESPRLGKKDLTRLEPGMVITVEPGVYRPGTGGVRIEDTVLVTETGCRVLTPTAKKLVAI